MWRLSLRTTLGHKRRLIATVLSVVIGIAFLSGTYVFTDSIGRTFDDLFGSVYASTDAVVRSSEKLDIGQGVTQRGRIDDDLVDAVRAVPGVAAAFGTVGGYARIIAADGDPIGSDQGTPNFGMDINDDPTSVWTLRQGRVPIGSTEMAMDAGSFEEGHFALGQQVTVISQLGSRSFTLVGVVGFGSADSPVGAATALFDLQTAQSFVGQAGMIDSVIARGDGSLTQAQLAERIRVAMPSGTETLTGAEMVEDQRNEIGTALGYFNTLLLVFAFVALFVGSFIIYNTFSIIVAQRVRENALLRALGASQRQVLGALLVEAVILGIVGSLAGFAAGFVMAIGLRGLLVVVGIDIPSSGLVLLPRTVIVSLVVGTAITVVAAVLPARRGSKVAPIAALRDVAVEPPRFSARRLASGLALAVVAVAAIVYGLTGHLPELGLGVLALFLALFVLGPLMSRPLARALGAGLPRAFGATGELARENAMRNPKRTARTAAALMVSVALVSAISVFASSVKASIRSVIGEQFVGDLVVSTNTFGFGGLPTSLATEIGQVDGVRAAAGIQIGLARIGGSDAAVTVVDPAIAGKLFDLRMQEGTVEALTDQGLLVSREKADDTGLRVGDRVTLTFLDGRPHDVTVTGIYERDEMAGPYTIAKSLYATSGGDQYDFSVYVGLDPDASPAKVEAAIAALVQAYPTAELETRSGYIASQAAQIDQFVNLVYGLLALAVVIAVFGIANALSLSVYERTHEIGLLRAVGALRRQIRSLVRWEAVITALIGAAQGVVVGVALGWAVVRALRSEGFTTFQVPVVSIVVVLALAVLCGVIAASRPARRAAKLDVLSAIATE
jgi:putative ABC transport system permease protein